MKPKTVAALRTLEEVEWFHAVGKPDLTGVKQAKSWLEAVAFCVGRQWENALTEAMNQLHLNVSVKKSKSTPGLPDQNTLVEELRPAVKELVQKKTQTVIRQHGLPNAFYISVGGGIIGLALECEYSDFFELGFFTKTFGDCLLKGHFPCGWEGEFPQGRLIVY